MKTLSNQDPKMTRLQILVSAAVAIMATTASAFSSSFIPQSSSLSTAARPQESASALRMNIENIETKDIVKVGVIGMGRIGLVHLEAITKAPGVTPVIVSNPTISKAEAGMWVFCVHGCVPSVCKVPSKIH